MVGQIVIHKSFGEGTVVKLEGSRITVRFSDVDKTFAYPYAFNGFLEAQDTKVMDEIEKEINESEANRLIKLEEANKAAEARQIKNEQTERIKRQRVHPRTNIAFKCNYCDGGMTLDCIGFKGVCSDEMIRHNIQTEHHVWCCSEDCTCRHYFDGVISRADLEKFMSEEGHGSFVCYESSMLKNWRASAGIVQTGANKGKPMRLVKVQTNSLAVLTTRKPGSSDDNRFIFAVFLVDEAHEGDNWDEGYVTTRSEYKIEMKPWEAPHLKFWNYYYNPNAPELIKFGSGLHRYLSDDQAAQILRDITVIKKGTLDEDLAERFYKRFCDINNIDSEKLLEPNGALRKL